MISRLASTISLFGLLVLLIVACAPTEPTLSILQPQEEAVLDGGHPTLADFWDGTAEFVITVPETGLPMGESETMVMENGHFWSYVHASDRSAGTIDRCGDPVEFPGCTVIYYSDDGGFNFKPEDPPICQFECNECPCTIEWDHIDQQQYPDIAFDGENLHLVYEHRASTQHRVSSDGHNWSTPVRIGETGQFTFNDKLCTLHEYVGKHPWTPKYYDCLAGAPPGIFIEEGVTYVFVGMGQNPGHMGCYKANTGQPGWEFQQCAANPLFTGAETYGPDVRGSAGNPYFDYRTISSAETIAIGSGKDRRYYMTYEGVRGPGPGDPGDTQFGLGLARSKTNKIDGPWEKFNSNPILVDVPSNIGIGHADIIVHEGKTIIYTSLDHITRSRLDLVWSSEKEKEDATTQALVSPEISIQDGKNPTLADFWAGKARFTLDIANTGLPLGESESVKMGNGEWWSYLHASEQSAGTVDQCGDPVAFPGCTVIYKSQNDGRTFSPDPIPVCQFECTQCPCDSVIDHIDQQQYPETAFDGEVLHMVYEYRGSTKYRWSTDGVTWSEPEHVATTGHWKNSTCEAHEAIGPHPFVPYDYECLAGAPPGIFIKDETIYIFVAMGQSPGHMGCFRGETNGSEGADVGRFTPCENNPLFTGASTYGPIELRGEAAHPYFDFRTISSAEILPVATDEGLRYFMLYEGIRGAGPGDAGDTQFSLALARSLTDQLDGPWEKFPDNPILVPLPGNVGLGHADLIVEDNQTFLYTSLDGRTRSRLRLVWLAPDQ